MFTLKITIVILGILLILYFNLGKFVDISATPIKSDIIVSLGGDEGCRIRKSVQLYQDGFSKSHKLIYTGNDAINKKFSQSGSRYDYFKLHGVTNIIHINGAVNTMEELFYIKKYMLKNNYHSVLIVSHPFHSRRIIALANYIANYEKDGLHINVVSCNPKNWDKLHYYQNKREIISAISETVKLVYNMIKYSPLCIGWTNLAYKEKNGTINQKINLLH